MKEGLYSFKQHLDQTKNQRAPSDKRIIQRDLINLQKNGFVYLDRIQQKKIDLLDLDKCLQNLNPHEHKQSESLNKHILQVQILGGLKQQEDFDKLEEFIQQKQNKQYEEQINQLTNANQFQQKHHLFFDGKRRAEDINIVEEKAYVRTHRLGALLSCLKSNPKYKPDEQQQQVDEQSQINQQEELSNSQQKSKKTSKQNDKTIPQLIADLQQQEPELSKEFLTVFKNDTTLNKQKLQAVFPKIDFDKVQLEKKFDLSMIETVEKSKDSTLAPLKINKVTFNPVAKQIIYDVDTYEENGESVFKKMEDFHESLRKGQSQDTITDKTIEIVTEAEKQEYKWSQNYSQLNFKNIYINLDYSMIFMKKLRNFILNHNHKTINNKQQRINIIIRQIKTQNSIIFIQIQLLKEIIIIKKQVIKVNQLLILFQNFKIQNFINMKQQRIYNLKIDLQKINHKQKFFNNNYKRFKKVTLIRIQMIKKSLTHIILILIDQIKLQINKEMIFLQVLKNFIDNIIQINLINHCNNQLQILMELLNQILKKQKNNLKYNPIYSIYLQFQQNKNNIMNNKKDNSHNFIGKSIQIIDTKIYKIHWIYCIKLLILSNKLKKQSKIQFIMNYIRNLYI